MKRNLKKTYYKKEFEEADTDPQKILQLYNSLIGKQLVLDIDTFFRYRYFSIPCFDTKFRYRYFSIPDHDTYFKNREFSIPSFDTNLRYRYLSIDTHFDTFPYLKNIRNLYRQFRQGNFFLIKINQDSSMKLIQVARWRIG